MRGVKNEHLPQKTCTAAIETTLVEFASRRAPGCTF